MGRVQGKVALIHARQRHSVCGSFDVGLRGCAGGDDLNGEGNGVVRAKATQAAMQS